MIEGRKLFQLVSTISRQHGLLDLDPSERRLFDFIFDREITGQKTTAGDLIAISKFKRALVYRKLKSLKESGWIEDRWLDFKLHYVLGQHVNRVSRDLLSAWQRLK